MKQLLGFLTALLFALAVAAPTAAADWDYGYYTDYGYDDTWNEYGYHSDYGWHLEDDSWLADDELYDWDYDYAYDYDNDVEYQWEYDYDFWDGYEWELERQDAWF